MPAMPEKSSSAKTGSNLPDAQHVGKFRDWRQYPDGQATDFLMIIKERGPKVTLWIVVFVFPFAFLVGGLLNFVLRHFKIL